MPEPLPIGANFKRAKTLWEVCLDIAGDINTPYYGPRDICIAASAIGMLDSSMTAPQPLASQMRDKSSERPSLTSIAASTVALSASHKASP